MAAIPKVAREHVADLLQTAGISIGGTAPWDLRVLDERFYERVLDGGSLGAGEAYMDGWWDADRLDEFFARVHRARLDRKFATVPLIARAALAKIGNLQGRRLSLRVAEQHYDLSNELYVAMLGETMQYTCAYYLSLIHI